MSENNGKVNITTQDISITSSQVSDKTDTYNATGTTLVTGKAIANAISSLNQVNNSTGTTTEKFKSLGNGIKGVGSTLTLATVPLTAFGAGAIKTASDFQAGMSKVQALSGLAN